MDRLQIADVQYLDHNTVSKFLASSRDEANCVSLNLNLNLNLVLSCTGELRRDDR